MQLPLSDPDTLFEDLLQDLPAEVTQMAREFKAFVRAKKVKTPEQLLRLVFLYCGLDKSLRTVAGVFTALYEPITDQSVAERLRACGPWVKALLQRMLPVVPVAALAEGRRFLVIDASTVQAPGATGTDHRLHLSMDLVSLEFVEVLVTDVHSGETLKHFALGPGDVVAADRGYAHPQGMSAAVQQGADLIVRLNPFRVVLTTPTGQPVGLGVALKRQPAETIQTLPVVIRSACGQHEVRGWVHAYRLSAEQANRARQKCRQRHKKGQPQAAALFLAGWVLVFTTLAPAVLSAETILAVYRCRWQVEVCQSQPVKMTWGPLRLVVATIIYLRGLVKREDIGDVDLLLRDNDFFDQTLCDRLAIFERQPLQVIPQQLAKAVNLRDDLLPVERLGAGAS